MTQWIEVNGAEIAKTYVEDSVREARSCDWIEAESSVLTEHVHCLICGTAIPAKPPALELLYHSVGGFLCGFCYESFIRCPDDS